MIFLLFLSVFVLNIPFGYWRAGVRKFCLQWMLAIHLPIPVVVLLRVYSGIGFIWWSIPLTVAAFFAGQWAGTLWRARRALATDKPR